MKKGRSKYVDMVVVILCNPSAAKRDHHFERGRVVSEDFATGKLRVTYKVPYSTMSGTTSGWYAKEHVFAALDTVELVD